MVYIYILYTPWPALLGSWHPLLLHLSAPASARPGDAPPSGRRPRPALQLPMDVRLGGHLLLADGVRRIVAERGAADRRKMLPFAKGAEEGSKAGASGMLASHGLVGTSYSYYKCYYHLASVSARHSTSQLRLPSALPCSPWLRPSGARPTPTPRPPGPDRSETDRGGSTGRKGPDPTSSRRVGVLEVSVVERVRLR